ncbi:MAG TPA: C4-dicarboxylate ABC transporter permease [Peptococcaceae bacterium]|nr:C4-dicarboxylate ABC transporter permease [Peptococcaceae bacterium]
MNDLSFIITHFFATLSDPLTMFMVLVGTFMGLVFGALPGLTATMAVALLIPLTFTLDPVTAIGMMLGAYVGGIAGGAVSATLLNIPGTPSAVVTTLDGYPMAKQGRGAEALGWAAFASGFGSLISWLVLVLLAPALAKVCVGFASPEYAALAFFGLTIIAAVSGKSIVKGLIGGMLGMTFAFVGLDPIWGDLRFTFGNMNLMSGISIMPALIGLYSIPQILLSCTEKNTVKNINLKLHNFVPSPKKIWKSKVNIIRSSIIGTIIGIIPATGGNIAAFMSYDQAKRFSKDPDSFGKGNPDGVIASEAANNGVCGGALVPLMTLGIPGDSVTAVLLGGLLIHGLTPGPALFVEHYDIVIGIFTTLLVATIMMVLLQLVGIKLFVRILSVPVNYLSAGLVILSIVGSYALRSNIFDVGLTIALGILGYFMARADYPVAPVVLGLVLGGMFEREVRLALRLSDGSLSIFFTRPVACVIVLIAFAVITSNIIKNLRTRHKINNNS